MRSHFDPGLQPERTELAWRRTALALAIGSLIALRLLPAAFGSPWWALGGVAGLIVTGALFIGARRRYRTVNAARRRGGTEAVMPGGTILLALALFVLVIGLAGTAIVVTVAVLAST